MRGELVTGEIGQTDTQTHQVPITSYAVSLGRDMFIYGTGRVALPLLGLVTLPILTRFFGPADYGVIETITMVSSIVALFAGLMLESSVQRSYYDYRPEEKDQRRLVFSTGLFALLVWNVMFLSPVMASAKKIGSIVFSQHDYDSVLLVALAGIPIYSTFSFLKEIFRLENQPMRYTWYTVGSAVWSAGLSIIMVVYFGMGLFGFFLGSVVGYLFILPLLIYSVRGAIGAMFSGIELKRMLRFGFPLIPTSFSIWILTLSDRFFLVKFRDLTEVGLYSMGVKVTQLILLFITAFGLAWSPFILSIYSKDKAEEKRVRARVTTYYVFVLLLLAAFVGSFSRVIIHLLATAEFVDAFRVVGLLAFGTAAMGATQALCTGISITRETKYFAMYTGVAAALNIVLNWLVIPRWGFLGAAFTTAISYVLLCALYYVKSQELYWSPYELGKLLRMGVAGVIVIGVGTVYYADSLITEILIKGVLFMSFPVLCLCLNVFSMSELARVKKEIFVRLRRRECT